MYPVIKEFINTFKKTVQPTQTIQKAHDNLVRQAKLNVLISCES